MNARIRKIPRPENRDVEEVAPPGKQLPEWPGRTQRHAATRSLRTQMALQRDTSRRWIVTVVDLSGRIVLGDGKRSIAKDDPRASGRRKKN